MLLLGGTEAKNYKVEAVKTCRLLHALRYSEILPFVQDSDEILIIKIFF